MGICSSKDATDIVETRDCNVDRHGVELKESKPNEPLPVEKVENDGDGVEEAGHTGNVSTNTVRAPNLVYSGVAQVGNTRT